MSLYLLLPLAGIILALLTRGRRTLRGSTLAAPWWWVVISILGLVTSEVAVDIATGDGEPVWGESLRYLATMLTFCPAMAVFGAKRPQNHAWQWVVATLWIVLALPAVQTVVYGSGPRVAQFAAWKLLVAALVAMEVLNYAVSRHRWAALLVVAAQLALVWRHFFGDGPSGAAATTRALGLVAVALVVVYLRGEGHDADETTALWRRFVDWYGSFWSFRVIGLLNQTAETARWPVRVMPQGFVMAEGDNTGHQAALAELPVGVQAELRLALRNTLRRFFSEDMLRAIE